MRAGEEAHVIFFFDVHSKWGVLSFALAIFYTPALVLTALSSYDLEKILCRYSSSPRLIWKESPARFTSA